MEDKMKHFLLAILLSIILIGCTAEAVTTDADTSTTAILSDQSPVTISILNSAWTVVYTESVTADKAYARTAELQDQVTAYNASTTEDKETLATGDELPPDPGPVTMYLVYSDDWTIYEQVTEERVNEPTMLNAFHLDMEMQSSSSGRAMQIFVDNLPPQPAAVTPPAPIDPYIQYAIYEVDVGTGAIIYEEHATADTFYQRHQALGLDVEMHNGQHTDDLWYLVSGQLYTPPSGG
jgi:hypothetical protein